LRTEYDFSKAQKGKYSRRFEMSLEKCTGTDGRPGYRWGNGKCHTGSLGKERAEAEGATEIVAVATKAETKSAPTVKVEAVKMEEVVKVEAPIKRKRGPAKKKTTE